MKNILRTVSYTLGGLGASVAIIPFIPGLFTQIGIAVQQQQETTLAELRKSQIQRGEQIKQFEMNERAKTLDTASKIGEHITYGKAVLNAYTDNPNIEPTVNIAAVKPNENLQVFDRNGVCVGRIRNQKFEWKKWYQNACLTITKTEDK